MDDVAITIAGLRAAAALVGDLSWLLWPQQIPIYQAVRSIPATIDEYVVLCARQFGKSHLGVLLAIEDAIRNRDRCILIIGPDTKQTKDIVNPRMRRIARHLPDGLLVQSKSENRWIVYHDRDRRQQDFSEIVIGGMNENSSSQRGKTVQTIFVEEIVEVKPDDYLESLRSDLGPAMTHSDQGKIVFLTTLPKIPDHPFITETLTQAKLRGAFAQFTIDDNKELSPEQYDACVRRCGGKDTDDFKREYLCQIVRDSSVVVAPDFNESRHVVGINVPAFTHWNVMVDWGGVRDYTVGLLYTYDYYRNKLLFYREFLHYENTPTTKIWPGVETWMTDFAIPQARVWADAPGQTLVDLAAITKTPVSLPTKDDWEAMINALNVRLRMGFIEIDPACKFLIESLRSGTFNKNRTDFERTKALGHCDAIAAIMYAIRHFEDENPYPVETFPSDRYFKRPDVDPDAELGESIVGRGFGRFR